METHSGTPECHEKPFPRNLYDRRYGERQGYRRRIILDATRCFLFLHASLRGESDARKGFRHESHAEGTARVLCETVEEAVEKALKSADKDDLIFIGGSTFIVADALPCS